MPENKGVTDIIRTVSDSQVEIMQGIMRLYCGKIDLDPTYGYGTIYRGVREPVMRFDIEPKSKGTRWADSRVLPLTDECVRSVLFDPPFVAGGRVDGKDGVMKSRYGMYPTIPQLWRMYRESMDEIARVLKPQGILVFKCQDTVAGRMQCLSHVEIINYGLKVGLFPEDLFILTAKARLIRDGQKEQIHARKYHSYFIVFRKCKSQGHYT